MARFKASKALTKGPVSHSAPFQNIPIQIWEYIVWMLDKDDKIALLISCRGFLNNRGVFKINRPANGRLGLYRWSLLVQRIGSGGNTDNWAHCQQCKKMLPTKPEKWEGSHYRLPVRYLNRNVPLDLKNEYRRMCFQWANKTDCLEVCRGGNVMARRCPECFLRAAVPWAEAGEPYATYIKYV